MVDVVEVSEVDVVLVLDEVLEVVLEVVLDVLEVVVE